MEITPLSTNEILLAAQDQSNIAELLDDESLTNIAQRVVDDYNLDKDSRSPWEDKMMPAMKLVLQVMENKNFPWDGAANVKFPLMTIAALRFQAEAYPALISGTQIVKMRVIGKDPDNEKAKRAVRISTHMSYQLLEEDEEWEENTDLETLVAPIMGAAFKKSYYDPSREHNVSECVLPEHIVIPYYAKSVETAQRITHEINTIFHNDLIERQRSGIYRDVELGQPRAKSGQSVNDESTGMSAPHNDEDAPYNILEQHRWLDLDGDGYKEPYIVTVDKDSVETLRIAARFTEEDVYTNNDGDIAKIDPIHHFTRKLFIPSPDGGIYGLGFGILLGPVNETVNTIINQLLDAGTMATLGGGFLGRGIRIKKGSARFKPFEWKQADFQGDDIRKGILPLPVREPSNVLFQLLGLLIDYGERLTSTTDMRMGESPGQNQTATTTMAVLEQGQKIYSAIIKRMYRGLKSEFRKLYRLNSIFLDPESYYEVLDTGQSGVIYQQDYKLADQKNVRPAADPNMVTDTVKISRAQALVERATGTPGYNPEEVERRFLMALQIPDMDKIYPGWEAFPPRQDPKAAIEQAKNELKQFEAQRKFELEEFRLINEVQKTDADIALMEAQIVNLEAQSILALAKADAQENTEEQNEFQKKIEIMKVRLQQAKIARDIKADSISKGKEESK